MKRRIRVAAALLAAMLLLTGCSGKLSPEGVMSVIAPTETPLPGADIVFSDNPQEEIKPLELTYHNLNGNFCPFWADADGDRLVVSMTQLKLTDGAEITREDNGDGSAVFTIRLRDGLKCSDGFALTADDLLFTYYVLVDAAYEGPYLLKTLPIRGLSSYWNGMDMDMFSKYIFVYEDLYRGGRFDQDLKDAVEKAKQEAKERGVSDKELEKDPAVKKAQKALDEYDSERADQIRAAIDAAWRRDADQLVEYLLSHYSVTMTMGTDYTIDQVMASPGLQVMFAMREKLVGQLQEDGSFKSISGATWDLQEQFPTAEDFYKEMYTAYNGDAEQYWLIEGIGRPSMLDAVENDVVMGWAAADPDWRGTIDSVEGIEKLDGSTIRITLEICDDAMAAMLTDIYVAPLHVYGNSESFDVGKANFGFPKGDLKQVQINEKISIGCGEYVYRETDIRTVYLDANPLWWGGESGAKEVIITKEG